MSDRTIDEVLFGKFVEISERQASALATLADRQKRDDEVLGKLGAAQENIVRAQNDIVGLVSRVAERLDHMDEEAQNRTERAVQDVKGAIALEVSRSVAAGNSGDRWTKILCALLGFIAAALTALVVIQTRTA